MADSFTNVFGGSPVQPSEVRYRAIDLTADVHLFWPSQSVDTNDVIARWNDVTAESANLNIIFPSATTIGPGEDAVFANKGSNSFNVLAVDLTTIASVAPGVAMYIINSSNTTDAGAWQLTIFGGTASQVNAAALAGDGLKASNAQLQVNFPIIPIASNYVSTFTDLANVLNWTGGAGTITLPSASVAAQGWFCEIRNSGSGSVVVSPPSGLIDGGASKTYAQTESSLVHTDGTNYYTVGYGRAVTSSFARLVVSVAGNTNVTLTSAQAQNQMLEFTGALTGDITVFVPANVAEYFVYNHTTGAHTLTFSATGGTGAIVIQGQRRIAVCDGTNVAFADTLGTGTVTQVNSGTGLTGGPITATGTLAIASTGVSPGSYTLLAATVNAQGQITAASSGSLDIIGNVQGNILYRNATVWTSLAPGTNGQFLTTHGGGANPTWSSPSTAFLPLTGGTLSGPGNLIVGGTLNVTGTTTTAALVASQLQVSSAAASLFLTTTSHHQWQVLSNTDNGFYIIDNTAGATRLVIDSTGHATFTGALTCSGNFNTNAISGTTGLFSSTLQVNGTSTLIGTIACNAINCSTINTQGNNITTGSLTVTPGIIACNAISCGTLTTNGQAITAGAITTSSDVNVGGNLQAPSIVGNTTFNASVGVSGNLTVAGNIASGAQLAGSTLALSGSGTVGTFFTVNGNLTTNTQGFKPGGGTWAATSDERIKDVLGEYKQGLAKVLQLHPVTYAYKGNDTLTVDDPSPHVGVATAKTPFVGFIAQQLEKVFPEMVSEAPGFIDGQSVSDLRSVDSSSLVYALVNAVKELSARIEILEGK